MPNLDTRFDGGLDLFVEIESTGATGKSAYEVWVDLGNTGTEQDFLDSLVGETGPIGPIGETGPIGPIGETGPIGPIGETGPVGPIGETGPVGEQGLPGTNGTDGTNGIDGEDGLSAYQIWLNLGNTGTEQDFINSLEGPVGEQGLPGTNGTDGTNGVDGEDGLSAYQIWLNLGNTGTEQDFIDSLEGPVGEQGLPGTNGTNGVDGDDGLSAYQIWLNLGNTGTEQDFINSLTGPKGDNGEPFTYGDFTPEQLELLKGPKGDAGAGTGDMLASVYDTNNNGIVDNAEKVNGFTIETAVPSGAKFTDTIVDITGKADKTYVDNKVKTDVPLNAKFTDTNTITSINGKTGVITKDDITSLGIPAQDTIVDISGKVDKITGKGLSTNDYTTTDKNKLTGLENYTHPATHPYSMITGGPTSLPASDVSEWAKASTKPSYTKAEVGLGNVDNLKQMPISGGVLEDYTEKLNTTTGAIDLSLGNTFYRDATANTTFSITNTKAQAHSFTLIIDMGATVRTLTFPTSVKWQDGEIPDLSTASKIYVLTFMTIDGGTTWLGMFGGEF